MRKVVNVRVQTKSGKPGIDLTADGSYRIRVSAAPEKGKANKEVIEILAAYFDVPPSKIKIICGGTSRHKRIEINSDDSMSKNP